MTQIDITPLLQFKDGTFRLQLPKNSALIYNWHCLRPGLYETTSLEAAKAFKRYSDEETREIFRRAFQELYNPLRLLPLDMLQDYLGNYLDPHQIEGVKWILSRKRSYLVHAPGAGKTFQAIAASLYAKGRKLFIVPPALTVNWTREIEKYWKMIGHRSSLEFISRGRREDTFWGAQFLVCPDSLLAAPDVYKKLLEMKHQFKFIAVDEASRFKEPTSLRTLALFGGQKGSRVFEGLYQDAEHVVLLDGSPMPNRPMELWAPTYAMDPEAIGCMDQHQFGVYFCGGRLNRYGRWEYRFSSHEEELNRRLTKTFMHVVGEDELSHPERRRSILFMNQDVRSALHKSWEEKHLEKIREFSEDISQGETARFRRELGLRKTKWISQYVRDRLTEKNERILLFVWHRDVALELRRELLEFDPGVIIGGASAEMRESVFEKFQKGKCRLIIGNISAMGRGHNLQAADRVIFGEFSWTDELNKQCEKRASRRGSKKSFVRCEYIVCPNSMDERVLSSNFTKEKRVKRIIG